MKIRWIGTVFRRKTANGDKSNAFCGIGIFLFALLVAWPRAEALATESLVFCVEKADVRPWLTQDGGGLNIELLNRVAKLLDINFSYSGMPWKRCLAQIKANEVAGAIGASFKTERLEMGAYPGILGTGTIGVSKPDANKRLNVDRYVLMRRKGGAVQWDGKILRGVDGAIGIQLGYSIGDSLRGMGQNVDEGSQRARELAQKLSVGRLGAAAMLDGEATSLMAVDPKLAAQLEILPTPLSEKPYFLMLSHALLGSRPELAIRIWNAVEQVRNSAAYQKLERDTIQESSRQQMQ